jgi:predicted nucleotidyltransferase component of viral defense system
LLKSKIYKKIYLIISLFFIIGFCCFTLYSNTNAEIKVNWNQIKMEAKEEINKDSKKIIENFKLAVAYANLGEIKDSYDTLNKLDEMITIKEFEEILNIHIKELNQKQTYKNKLLVLNYNAFSAIIRKKYEESVKHLIKICELEPENIWIKNYPSWR